VVGDLIEQRVLLQAASHAVDLASLPRPARLNVWLERRQPRIAADSQGRHWLVVDYQLINAPQGLTTVNLPAWQLATKSGQSLSIPQWPVSVGPLTARKVIAQGGLQELRADRPAPSVPTEPIVHQIEIWSGALLLTLALWGGWLGWRNWRDALDRPFARAAREMRGVAEDAPQAWQALHRAFDRAAGRVIQTSTLGSLFERASYLEPLRPRIEEFFAQSVAYFFGDASGAQPAASVHARTSLRALSVRALCNDLRKIERRVQP
jgi:mxaA protein